MKLSLLCREDYFEYFCDLKRSYMKKSVFKGVVLTAVLAVLSCLTAVAGEPQADVKLILISVSGDSTVLGPGESAPTTLSAPLRVIFVSSLKTDDGKDYVMFPQWTVTHTDDQGREESYLKRQEAVTEYRMSDNGSFKVEFAWSYREKDSLETIPGADVQPMTFSIIASEIRLYNAFSPNGDGINDVYRIYTRSIVSIKIAIYNRWGQTIKTISGPMDQVLPADAEPENEGYLFEIWDGTFNGSVVNDGVYFINVQATGAGGETYEKRSDINVLKGLGVGN